MSINATLLSQMIVFATFVGLTRRYIWPPILDILDQRKAEIAKGLDDAEKAHQALATASEEKAKLIGEAKAEAKKVLAMAQTTAQQIIEEAKAEGVELKEKHILAGQDALKQQLLEEEKAVEEKTLLFMHQVLERVMVKLPEQEQLNAMINTAIGEVDER